jgi:hypothetical protein
MISVGDGSGWVELISVGAVGAARRGAVALLRLANSRLCIAAVGAGAPQS